MKLKFILLVVLVAFAGSAKAQDPRPQERPDEREQSVINEDGGRSFIIKPASAPLHGVVKPGSATVVDLQQHSIFLGSHWAEPAPRARETQLSSLLVNIHDHAQMDELTRSGIKNLFGATTSQEKLDVPSDRLISDLEIQGVLTAMFKEGTLPRPDAGAIYVVFLDPGLRSTLGPLVAGKHYVAYHGFLNAFGAKIHYAVVPFQSDSQGAYQIALRALVVAALNPTGSSPN
ncbi:MAG: hypothetical protein DMF70_13680 [Acidobacteria bacterium]|nr:MAG: hypothetical protein DMF70_13680 [Acidobacteriota bacterium]